MQTKRLNKKQNRVELNNKQVGALGYQSLSLTTNEPYSVASTRSKEGEAIASPLQ